jgi:hypothetical protein
MPWEDSMNIWGHVDEITSDRIVGWAADLDHPHDAVDVLIAIDGEPLGPDNTMCCYWNPA